MSATPRTDRLEVPAAALRRRFEAVVFDWDEAFPPETAPDGASLRDLLGALCRGGMHVGILSGRGAGAIDERLGLRPAGPGRLYLLAPGERGLVAVDARGLRPLDGGPASGTGPPGVDGSAPRDRVARELRRLGIDPRQVLFVGEAFRPSPVGRASPAATADAVVVGVVGRAGEAGGDRALLGILRDQLARRLAGALPDPPEDPAWTLAVRGFDPELERVRESLLCLADGRFGTRGVPLAPHPATSPAVFAGGVYAGGGPTTELARCPVWNLLSEPVRPGAGLARVLDLRTGVLSQELRVGEGRLTALSFSSLARPGLAVLRVRGTPGLLGLGPGPALLPPDGTLTETGEEAGAGWMRVRLANAGTTAAAAERRRELDDGSVLDRVAVLRAAPGDPPPPTGALADAGRAATAGFETLLAEQREAWARRWDDADVQIEGDPELQQAVRFALFHLMASVADEGEAAVGARGLSGPAYRGHVFWDSDVFVLPFLAATHPPAARAMLEYRVRRLPAAMAAARALEREGARFPWESAAEGADVTPRSAFDRTGHPLPIRTGLLEEHIVADVAWAAACYEDWTGDDGFREGAGLRLMVETARYWASRARSDLEGRAHLYGVIGPDEYHEPVDDNAYTNVMARWNLRRAAAATAGGRGGVGDDERRTWLELADALVDGYDPRTGLYEQFSGFFGLEPLVIEDFAPRRPVAADLLLGRERIGGAQVIKQADVLMLHHLAPDETAEGSLEPNLLFYEPRTAHGSSLSPGVHAALFARAGRTAAALRALQLAARLDLDDLTRTTAGGLHLATMGTVWQALVFGFAGIRPSGEALRIDPRLPPSWDAMGIRLRFRGSRVRIRADASRIRVAADPPIRILVGAPGIPATATPDGTLLERRDRVWSVMS